MSNINLDGRYGITFSLRFSNSNEREAHILSYLAGLSKSERVKLMKDAIEQAVLEQQTSIVDPWTQKQLKGIKAIMSEMQKQLKDITSKLASGKLSLTQEGEMNLEAVPKIAMNVAMATRKPGMRLEDMNDPQTTETEEWPETD